MFPRAPVQLPGCRLRPLQPGEAEPLGQSLVELSPWSRLGFAAKTLALYLERADPALSIYAIDVDGVVAGTIALRYPWLRGPYLELMAILPAYQRWGLGARALDWAGMRAKQAGAANLWACVSEFNETARAFYSRQGFVETTPLDGLVDDGETEILLRKRF